MIRPARLSDAPSITKIYNHYVKHSIATFEEQALAAAEMQQRMQSVFEAELPWLVAEDVGKLVGYAYASPFKTRSAYRFSVEVTVYLAAELGGGGWGTMLYNGLFEQLKERSVHAIIAGISLPNPASVKLHENKGMQKVAHFNQVGYKFNQWVDVGYWQLLIDSDEKSNV